MRKDNNYHVKMWDSWSKSRFGKPVYDLWLSEYLPLFKKSETILDLGCGIGANTLYLIEKGYSVLSCDYSKEALKNIDQFIEKSNTKYLNMNNSFPFDDESFSIIIADISLHYFTDEKTIQIMKEIKRVLKYGGYLIARVSSIHDAYNVNEDENPDSRYIDYGCYGQRYFNEQDLERYFGLIGDYQFREVLMTRDEEFYSYPKALYQILVNKD